MSGQALSGLARRSRLRSLTGDPPMELPLLFFVAQRHEPFVRLLLDLGLMLAVVPLPDARLCLGVRCRSEPQARRTTADILGELLLIDLIEPDQLDGLNLGEWMARRVGRRLTLYWPVIEVRQETVH